MTPDEFAALTLSLKVAAASLALLAIPGVFLGWLLARRDFPGKTALDVLVHLPLVLPPVVTGWLLLRCFGRRGWLGAWLHDTLGISLAFNWKGAALAAAVMALPLLVRAVRLAIALVDRGLEEAAATCGANPWRVFITVTIPLAAPGLIAGFVLAFARSLGEFGATITFAGNIPDQTRTLPVAIFAYTQLPDGDAAVSRLAIASVVLAVLALVASEWLTRRWQRRLGSAS